MIVTIDGPAGTGKTTVAQKVAQTMGFEYFDTGAMYRTFTLFALNEKIAPTETERLIEALKHFDFDVQSEKEVKKYFLNKVDVSKEIRDEGVTNHVSLYAAVPEVREHLVLFQKKFASARNVVFEGRDMGTVVFPNAEHKFFLNATLEVRAERRFMQEHHQTPSSEQLQEVEKAIQSRDQMDETRKHSPLKKAHDAQEVDTSNLTIDEVVQEIINSIKRNV